MFNDIAIISIIICSAAEWIVQVLGDALVQTISVPLVRTWGKVV